MMPINFYKKGTPGQHKAVMRWFSLSTLLAMSVIIGCATLQIQQSSLHTALNTQKDGMQKQLTQLDCVANKYQTEHALREILTKKSMKIIKHTQKPKNPVAVLKHLKTAFNKNASIEKIAIDGQNIEIKIASEHQKRYRNF